MATYNLKWDHAPDVNPDTHTSTMRIYCCGVDLGTKTSGPANGSGGSTRHWVEQTISLTTHMTADQPKANHYVSWHYVSGSDGSNVRNMRIESSVGGNWPDQYGSTTTITAFDGGGDAFQRPDDDPTGSFVNSAGRAEHFIENTDASADYPTTRVHFQLRPDSNNEDEYTRISCYFNNTYLGDAIAGPSLATPNWQDMAFDIDGLWVGDGTDEFKYRYYTTPVTAPFPDAGYVRNATILDTSDALIEADQYYPLHHGDVVEATASGYSNTLASRTEYQADVCTYTGTTVTGDGYVFHNFPGDRCSPLQPSVGEVRLG